MPTFSILARLQDFRVGTYQTATKLITVTKPPTMNSSRTYIYHKGCAKVIYDQQGDISIQQAIGIADAHKCPR